MLVVLCASIVALMSWPSFGERFYSEAFQYIGQWRDHGESILRAAATPTNDGWLKPVDIFVSLIVFSIVPLEPVYYHVVNFAITVVLIAVLLAATRQISPSPWAQCLPLLWFSVSRVHLTTIGYVNLIEELLSALFILSALVLLERYFRTRSIAAYAWSVVFGLLAIFTMEKSIALVPAVAALTLARGDGAARWLDRVRRAALLSSPFVAAAVAMFALRWWLVGSVLPTTPVYATRFTADAASRQAAVYLWSLSNTAFAAAGRIGVGGIGWWLGHAGLVPSIAGAAIDAAVAALTIVVLIVAMVRYRHQLAPAAGALGLMAGSLVVHMTTRNLHLYYTLAFAVGATILMSVLIAQSPRGARWVAAALIAIVAVNGVISNRHSVYDWQNVARDAGNATPVLVDLIQASPASSYGLITSKPDYWAYVLGQSGAAFPMLPELSGRRDIRIRYVTPDEYRADRHALERDGALYVDIDRGFRLPADVVPEDLVVTAVHPNKAMAGTVFNAQPNGEAALAVVGANITAGTNLFWGDVELVSVIGNATLVTAFVPGHLFASPGRYTLHLDDGARRSNPVFFDVLPTPERRQE